MSVAGKRADEFLLGLEKKVRTRSAGGGTGRVRKGSGLINLVAAANKKPEVMIKIARRKSNASTGIKGVANHIDYISRNGKVDLEDNHGLIINGKEVKSIAKDWAKAGMIHDRSTKREALNVILSMPPGIDPEKVRAAGRQFAKEVFDGHEYVFALHTDTDHPHVHIAVTMQNELGQRINPRKNDLSDWRMIFAEKMREQGVECAATKRVHRAQFFKPEKSEIRNIKNRNAHSYIDQQKINDLKEAIKKNKRPIHPFLKEQLSSRNFVVSEYKTLSRLLYQEGLKTEAKAISKLATEMSNKKVVTQAQAAFDKAFERDLEI